MMSQVKSALFKVVNKIRSPILLRKESLIASANKHHTAFKLKPVMDGKSSENFE